MIPDYKAIGKRIKSARIKAAMNQEELANQVDISTAQSSLGGMAAFFRFTVLYRGLMYYCHSHDGEQPFADSRSSLILT